MGVSRMHELRKCPCAQLDHAMDAHGLVQRQIGMIDRNSDIFGDLFGQITLLSQRGDPVYSHALLRKLSRNGAGNRNPVDPLPQGKSERPVLPKERCPNAGPGSSL